VRASFNRILGASSWAANRRPVEGAAGWAWPAPSRIADCRRIFLCRSVSYFTLALPAAILKRIWAAPLRRPRALPS